ncbi:hypothetical protein C8R45DRAFT_1081878 [Mycena sanguinolenta]|nr:hypothetical protein C8R45DRAFT_1081878 [Mycena sanguinolenta]
MKPLPQELIDAIVGFVPDNNSLIACALTATSFVSASQRRVFHTMQIESISVYERLAAILAQSPHLGGYVRILALIIEDIPADWDPLKCILSTMTRVEKLAIQGRSRDDQRPCLRHNPSLIDFLYEESLMCVALAHLCDVPSYALTWLLESYEKVSLMQIDIFVEDQHAYDSPPTSDVLWHLDILDTTNSVMPFLLRPPQRSYFPSLTNLAISQYSEPNPDPDRDAFLAACAPTLQVLEIEFSFPFALPTLPSLWRLELWADADEDGIPSVFQIAVPIALQATPSLEHLTIAIRDSESDEDEDDRFEWGRALHDHEWLPLEDRLLEMHAEREEAPGSEHPKLGEVHFSLRYSQNEPERYQGFVSDVSMQLPRAFAVGLVAFSYRTSRIQPMFRFAQYE